jgi:predicted nucleotidyltransferase
MDKELIKRKIKEAVVEKDATAQVILFGSRARGTETAESDWDVLVLLDKEGITFRDEQKNRHRLYDVELEIEEPISTFVYALDEWNTKHSVSPLFKNIQSEGVKL